MVLLDSLEARDINNSVIMIHNYKYRNTLPEGAPKLSWKKQHLIEYYCLKNILTHKNDTKSVLWGRFNGFIR